MKEKHVETINGKRVFSLQYKIMLFSLVITLIPLITIGTFSYANSSKIIDRRASEANLETIKQIDGNIEYIISDVHDTSLYLIQQDKLRTYLLTGFSNFLPDRNDIANYILFLVSPKSYIYSVYIRGCNGKSFDTNSAINRITYTDEEKVKLLNGGYMWNSNTVTDSLGQEHKVFSIIRLIKDVNNVRNTLGILKINVNESQIFKIYSGYSSRIQSQKGRFFIMGSNGRYVSVSDKKLIGCKVPGEFLNRRLEKSKCGYYTASIKGQEFLISFCNVEGINWRIISALPVYELQKDTAVIGKLTLFLSIVSFIICMLFIIFFTHKIILPVRSLSSMMKNMENGDFTDKFNVKGNDEIALLGNSFNKMSEKLNELVNEVYTMKIKKKEAEFMALQAQINPHFLYNTLDTIYWLSQSEGAGETSKMVLALSKLFRITLNRGSGVTTVFNEVEHLNNYIIIQQKRYSDKIKFNTEISDETMTCKTVNLILQPLVENAINHGIIKNGGSGNISIQVFREDSDLIYKIRDDGIGADPDEMKLLLEKVGDDNRGFGIKNVNDRIRFYFGENYGLKFISALGKGMTVVVRQPFIYN